MAHHMIIFLLSSFLTLAALHGSHAVEYTVTNTAATTPGGVKFTNEIGDEHSKQTLISASDFIWEIFQQSNAADRKNVERVSLFIDDMDGIAYTVGDKIHVSARYIQSYSSDVKREIDGVLYHEMTHVWQWDGNGNPNGKALIEGIADFVRLKAGLAPSHWVQPGEGDQWDQQSDVTARFLDYCEGLRNGFVAEFNKKMIMDYNVQYFFDLLGKTVDQLWSDYKAAYQN